MAADENRHREPTHLINAPGFHFRSLQYHGSESNRQTTHLFLKQAALPCLRFAYRGIFTALFAANRNAIHRKWPRCESNPQNHESLELAALPCLRFAYRAISSSNL